MTILKSHTRQPAEHLDYDFDYSKWLNVDDDIISATFAVEFLGTPAPVAPMVIDSTVIQPTFTKVWVSGGTAGEVYKVSCTITTSRGRVKQDEIKIRLREF